MKKLLILTSLLILSVSTVADEVEDAIKQATDLYKSGNSQQAITHLDYAAKLIREQRGETLKKLLPKALSGWEAEDAEVDVASGAMFGGGISVSQSFVKGEDNSVSISISADSPMLQSVAMMLSNPMLIQSQGAKLKMIKGQQVIFSDGNAMAVVNNSILVQVEGSSSDNKGIDPDVLAYIELIDFAGIASFK